MLKKLLITSGIGLTAYVINEVRKEYDKNVSDYNNLLDRYNELCDYKYHDSPNSGKRYLKETFIYTEMMLTFLWDNPLVISKILMN